MCDKCKGVPFAAGPACWPMPGLGCWIVVCISAGPGAQRPCIPMDVPSMRVPMQHCGTSRAARFVSTAMKRVQSVARPG